MRDDVVDDGADVAVVAASVEGIGDKRAHLGLAVEARGHGGGVVKVSRKAGSGSGGGSTVVVIKVTGSGAVGGSSDLDYLWASQFTDINGSYAWVDSGSAGDIYTRFIEPVQPATGRRYLALLSSQTYTGKPVYIAMSRYVDVACSGTTIELTE